MRVLVSWVGISDLRGADAPGPGGEVGPLCRLLRRERFDAVHVLNDLDDAACAARGVAPVGSYLDWLAGQLGRDRAAPVVHPVPAVGNGYLRAYTLAADACRAVFAAHGAEAEYHLLLSPGTPAMQVALVLAGRSLPGARLWATWRPDREGEADVERIEWPVHVTVDAPLAAADVAPWGLSADPPPPSDAAAFAGLVGESRALRQAVWLAERCARVASPVLLVGETGTGKELFARAVHRCSHRAGRLVSVNCAGLPEALLESELFGHEKGAFTGADRANPGLFRAADNGTLFLDEIGEMPAGVQAKLLRVLQENRVRPVGGTGEVAVDVRVVAATHRDLRAMVRAGRFREDLYYRVSAFVVRVPPLRERGGDAVLLARRFLADPATPGRPRTLSADGGRELTRYYWPGNVRELLQVVTRLRVLLPDDVAEVVSAHLRFGHELGASYLPDRPVGEMTPREFVARLSADLDELVRRFNDGDPRELPPARAADQDRLFNEYLKPLLLGRAYELAGGNGVRAGQMIGREKLERNKGGWLDDYRRLAGGSVEDHPPPAGPGDPVGADVEPPAPDEPRE